MSCQNQNSKMNLFPRFPMDIDSIFVGALCHRCARYCWFATLLVCILRVVWYFLRVYILCHSSNVDSEELNYVGVKVSQQLGLYCFEVHSRGFIGQLIFFENK